MALTIENTIDLTACAGNPAPKVVSQLSIIHESSDGELVQYYIEAINHSQGDKSTHAIGVYDKDAQTWSYHDYPELEWAEPGQRVCGNRIERLGVKAFPSLGAIAFYKLMHRKITRIVAPVNRKDNRQKAPELDAVVNPDGTVAFTITPPDKPEYECYRIVMDSGIYTEEYVTYDLELTAPAPHISGEYKCYAVGYSEEGLLFSKESNIITLTLTGQSDSFERPYYMKSELAAATRDADRRYRALEEYTEGLEERIRALEERMEPEPEPEPEPEEGEDDG